MARNDYGYGEAPRKGVTRYVVWTLLAGLAVGLFLYADGYFEDVGDLAESVSDAIAPQS